MQWHTRGHDTHIFHIQGMHCASCVLWTKTKLEEIGYISRAIPSLATHTLEVQGDFGNRALEDIARELTQALEDHGYIVSLDSSLHDRKWSDFTVAVPIALAFVGAFILLQKLGIVNLVHSSTVSYGTAFVVGIVASLSTCMAVVGGLVLSMSATFAREGDRVRPQILFHTGRIVSFFILGGVIGAAGASFTIGTTGTFVLGLLVGIVMLILGINLLDLFPSFRRFQPAMPKFLSNHALGISRLNHRITPFLVGIATFFLSCGFTQAMQLYSLTTGSFIVGGLTMLSFALGTLPVLTLIGLSSFSVKDSQYAGAFFKSAGLIVILFALFNITNSLVVIGLISPVFNF